MDSVMRLAVRPVTLAAALCAGVVALLLAVASAALGQDERVIGYAFAKASPLQVFDDPAMENARNQPFEFGVAYEVVERTSKYVKIRRPNRRDSYVRPAHISFASTPTWVAVSDLFMEKDRARIRFWESSAALSDFLSGVDMENSQFDYEEIFEDAPPFVVKFPVFATDTIELAVGERQVNVAGILLPMTREMLDRFADVQQSSTQGLEVQLLADVSGSTEGYLEPAVSSIVGAIERSESLSAGVTGAKLATFGLNLSSGATDAFSVSLADLKSRSWYSAGSPGPTAGDVEPLINGLLKIKNVSAGPDASVALIVLSGADVGLSGTDPVSGRSVSISDLGLSPPAGSIAMFALITPEPGPALESASRQLTGFSSVRYFDFSDSLGRQVAEQLATLVGKEQQVKVDPAALGPMIEAAHRRAMMAFVPRDLGKGAGMPIPPPYAESSDWFTIRLWVVLDELVLDLAYE